MFKREPGRPKKLRIREPNESNQAKWKRKKILNIGVRHVLSTGTTLGHAR